MVSLREGKGDGGLLISSACLCLWHCPRQELLCPWQIGRILHELLFCTGKAGKRDGPASCYLLKLHSQTQQRPGTNDDETLMLAGKAIAS